MFKKFLLLISVIIILAPLGEAKAFNLPNSDFPRLANLFWKTPLEYSEAKQLAKWDLIALDMQSQTASADNIRSLRKLNPNIIILAYTSSNEVPTDRLSIIEPKGVGLWHDLASGIQPEWYLKTYQGVNISWWTGNVSMNLYPANKSGKTYADYLVDFYANKILATGLWDGLLFDNIWQDVSWVNGDMDIDNDGYKDSAEKINRLWQASYNEFFRKLRARLGDKYLIIGNGNGEYHNYLNGRMFEGFPEYYENGWTGSIKLYENKNKVGYGPRLNIINSDTDNTGNLTDFRAMRFGLTSTLLYNGYYSFDYGPNLREQFWWYDEYDVNLGQAKSEPVNLLSQDNKSIAPGLWKREFANGIVLVNSTDKKQTISFNEEYEKIKGTQDKTINSGGKINSLSINSADGIILLRPISEIKNNVFINGSFARIFNSSGNNIRTGFFAYNQKYAGSNKIITTDLDGDGNLETVVADKSGINIYSAFDSKINGFYPFGKNYSAGLSLAIGDINHDGKKELIVGSEGGNRNTVKIFKWYGEVINNGWSAYRYTAINLGVNVAVGDVNGDGELEIITGAGRNGGPHVRIFDKNGKMISNGFFAYDVKSTGGVNVAVGDVNGDGTAEIVTGAGFGLSPEVKIFNQNGKKINSWLAYSINKKEGVKIVTEDLDTDGTEEIIALTTNAFTTSMFNN